MDLGAVLDYPCVVCHKHGCVQDHKWCYMDDAALVQTVLEGFGEMLRRSGHAQASYPLYSRMVDMMNVERQYVWPSVSQAHTTAAVCPPTFDVVDWLGAGNDVDALAQSMQNAYIAPPPYPTDSDCAMADDFRSIGRDGRFPEVSSSPGIGAPNTSYEAPAQYGPTPSYAASVPWTQLEGYVAAAARAAEPDGGSISYTVQPRPPHAERPFRGSPTPGPGPIPSISVIEHLEQGTYQHKQLVEGTPAGPIHFNAGLGVCFAALDVLANGGEPAFSTAASIGVKASVRFELLQLPRQTTMRQVRMRHGGGRGRGGGRPITLREMGERVFDELRKLMDHAEKRGDPLRHRGSVIDVERVVLLRVDHISRGSIQPILGIRSEG